jgi:hypothetical protein
MIASQWFIDFRHVYDLGTSGFRRHRNSQLAVSTVFWMLNTAEKEV